MKKILIILLALIALSVVGWLGVYQMRAPAIQAEIEQRVGEALTSNSLDWVEYQVDGRDVTLNGVAASEQMAQHALDTADIYGLNSLNSNISVSNEVAKAEPEPEPDNTATNDPVEAPEPLDTPAAVADPSQSDEQKDNSVADVAVQDVTPEGVAALPITMNIARDASGEYIFNGTVPDMAFKATVDQHLLSVGAAPSQAVWQVELSSVTPPENWQQNILNSISAVQVLQEGEANLANDQAMITGVVLSQAGSDKAQGFAKKIVGDFTTKTNFLVVAPPKPEEGDIAADDSEPVSLVGSDQYAAKFCQTEFNTLLKHQKIIFESGSAVLQENSTMLLDKISQVANRCPNHKIQVHGYTDSQGAAALNFQLSKVRAESVSDYLSQKGIEADRLVAFGHGEKSPVATNKTEAGRAQNRRIKLIVKGLKK